MGKESTTGHQEPNSIAGAAGTSTGNSGSGTAKTGGTGGRGRSTSKTKQGETTPKLVMVDVPDAEKAEEPKKKRGRPKGSTTKKKTAAKKKGEVDSGQLKMLLMTTTAIIASRPGFEDFMLTEDEAEQICTPLSNIMAKSEGVAGVAGEYADHIALAIACFTIFIPKFLMWKAKQPKRKEVKQNALPKRELPKQSSPRPEHERPNEGTVKNAGSGNAVGSGEPHGKEFGGSLHQLIPFGGF